MKANKIFNITAGVALILGATACSSDYLDLKPEGTLTYEEVLGNEEGATLAVNGMGAAMYKQYSNISDGSLGFNGEPSILQYYGECTGQDYVSMYWMMYGSTPYMNWDADGTSDMNSSSGSQPAWSYCYNLISMANNLITYTPKKHDEQGNVLEDPDFNFNPVPDVEGLYAFRYAQALTFRAHAYIHLMQIYCARYEDHILANGDQSLTVPLRLEYENQQDNLSKDLATWEELMFQIYADLQQAISIYQASGARRSEMWEPDIDIARGLLARAAMINHDWELAETMAAAARQDYPIMSADEYQEGFANPTSEWMWTNSGESQGLYFWSFGATYACNGAYPTRWGTIGAGGISNQLINEGLENKWGYQYDQRLQLFFSPEIQPVYRSDFFDSSQVDTQTMDINGQSGNLHKGFVKFCIDKYSKVQDFGWLPPYTFYGAPLLESGVYTTCSAVFGAQFKFWGFDNYSASFYPFMRASEMLLIEAEAAYMQGGKENKVNQLLTELNTKRYSTDRYGENRYDYTFSGN